MPRKRMISPEFFTSATINALPVATAMTFAGLWCYADDYGRAEDDVTMVKAAIWPRRKAQTEKRVASDLDALARAGLVCRYRVHGFPLLHLPSWTEHQKISHPTESKLAPCRSHDPEAWAVFFELDRPYVEKFRNGSGAVPETLASDSTPIEVKSIEEKLSADVQARVTELRSLSRTKAAGR